ncbi:hypothetical protein [Nitrosomonas sp. Nm166]|uniref:hypothetical protein n=1 Tax=Nitrosomonas sp. Nm166 TaxID=1881054 RepID=UPI0008F3AD72|nr:hypothetical protein [Nitrosomonas sp. Nm166]SFE88778.1 hypothetical protein SAMN05428977_103451 [Nitrosomonas sp. Nm166]
MRKLAHLIYGVIESGQPFDANFNHSTLAIQDGISSHGWDENVTMTAVTVKPLRITGRAGGLPVINYFAMNKFAIPSHH